MNNAPPISCEFDSACDQTFYQKCRDELAFNKMEETLIATEQMDEASAQKTVNKSRIEAKTNTSNTTKDKKSDYLFFALLEGIDNRLEALHAELDALYQDLKVKYGEDVIDGMAETYLPPEVLNELQTDEEKLKALADLMLNEDGSIKDEYKDHPEAQFVQKWDEAQELHSGKVTLKNGDLSEQKELATDIDENRNMVAKFDAGADYKFT